RERGLEVEVLVPLQQRLVHRLLRRPGHREDPAVGGDVPGILLQRPRHLAALLGLGAAPRGAADRRTGLAAERPGGDDARAERAALLEEIATADLLVEDRVLARLL